MAVQAIIRKSLDGQTPSFGARAASRELELDDYQTLFASGAIVTGVRDEAPMRASPLYARVLGAAWDTLPAEIRAMHDVLEYGSASGRASVERGRGVLTRLAAAIVGFPETSPDTPVSVQFDVADDVETWTRTFGGRSLSSRQFAGRGKQDRLLCERFGPLTFAMALVLHDGKLSLVLRGWSFFGLTLPVLLCARSVAYETVEDGRFRFNVEISHRITGLIIRYRGWLEPDRQQGLAGAPGGALTPVSV